MGQLEHLYCRLSCRYACFLVPAGSWAHLFVGSRRLCAESRCNPSKGLASWVIGPMRCRLSVAVVMTAGAQGRPRPVHPSRPKSRWNPLNLKGEKPSGGFSARNGKGTYIFGYRSRLRARDERRASLANVTVPQKCGLLMEAHPRLPNAGVPDPCANCCPTLPHLLPVFSTRQAFCAAPSPWC